jgi:hypothetical protein
MISLRHGQLVNARARNPSFGSQMLGTNIFRRMMANPPNARHKNHSRRAHICYKECVVECTGDQLDERQRPYLCRLLDHCNDVLRKITRLPMESLCDIQPASGEGATGLRFMTTVLLKF